jgi:hypothetical protein
MIDQKFIRPAELRALGPLSRLGSEHLHQRHDLDGRWRHDRLSRAAPCGLCGLKARRANGNAIPARPRSVAGIRSLFSLPDQPVDGQIERAGEGLKKAGPGRLDTVSAAGARCGEISAKSDRLARRRYAHAPE